MLWQPTGVKYTGLNGLVGAVDNTGGTQQSNKEYTSKFPKPDDFMDEIAKAGIHGRKSERAWVNRRDDRDDQREDDPE